MEAFNSNWDLLNQGRELGILGIFKNHPNCKKLFLENQDQTPAFEMLKEFQNEMYRRGGILNGKSIDEYNRENPNYILPRKILIIDEGSTECFRWVAWKGGSK